jgi:hypothetical protein
MPTTQSGLLYVSSAFKNSNKMANRGTVKLVKEGPRAWNAWRIENPDIRPDLSEADLTEWKDDE